MHTEIRKTFSILISLTYISSKSMPSNKFLLNPQFEKPLSGLSGKGCQTQSGELIPGFPFWSSVVVSLWSCVSLLLRHQEGD